MRPEIIVAIVTSASTLIAAIVSIVINNRLIGYKVDELSKKVEKHNNLVERMALAERDIKNIIEELKELKK